MKNNQETIGKAQQMMTFGEAITLLNQGKMVQRKGWNGKNLFVFRQVPSIVDIKYVDKMTSLPQAVKDEINRRLISGDVNNIEYSNQLALVGPYNNITGWSPSTSDALANDWVEYSI